MAMRDPAALSTIKANIAPRWLDRESDIYQLEEDLSAVIDTSGADYYAVYDQKETFDPNMLANHSIVNPFLSNGF